MDCDSLLNVKKKNCESFSEIMDSNLIKNEKSDH